MRTYIYSETTFQIYKNRGGMYVPQHKSPFSNKFESFTERSVTVIRARRSDAEKYIQRRAKVANPQITLVDGSVQPTSAPQLSPEEAALAVLNHGRLSALNERLNDPCLYPGGLGEQILLKHKQRILDWFASHNITVKD